MKVGDCHWIQMPGSGGHAQAGRRPAIIMQSETAQNLPTILIIPLTTQLNAVRFPGTVLIEATAQNGLKQNSVALTFQMMAIDRTFVERPLGEIENGVLAALWQAFDLITDRV